MASSSSFLASLLILSAALVAILAPTCSARSYLLSGDVSGDAFADVLLPDWSLENGNYRLKMQSDCNLVLYDHDKPVWASKTNYEKPTHSCRLKMQDDGNLVIYDTFRGVPIWASNSSRGRGGGKYVLVLQPDRNVVIYGPSIWAAGSSGVDEDGNAAVVVSRNSAKAAVAAADEITMVTGK